MKYTLVQVLIRDLRECCPKVIADKWIPVLQGEQPPALASEAAERDAALRDLAAERERGRVMRDAMHNAAAEFEHVIQAAGEAGSGLKSDPSWIRSKTLPTTERFDRAKDAHLYAARGLADVRAALAALSPSAPPPASGDAAGTPPGFLRKVSSGQDWTCPHCRKSVPAGEYHDCKEGATAAPQPTPAAGTPQATNWVPLPPGENRDNSGQACDIAESTAKEEG
jgi:hypothetical protein